MNSSAIDITEELRVTSYMEAMLPLSWVALLAGILALLVSLHLLFIKVGIDKQRLKHDFHYKLRCLLCICLVLNRLMNIIHQVITTKIATWPNQTTKTWQVYGHEMLPLRKTEFALYLMIIILYYIMSYFIFLLTVDRYKRVSMVLPGSRMAITLQRLQYIILVGVFMVVVMYFVDYTPRIVTGRPLDLEAVIHIIWARNVTEIVTISVEVALDYAFTIRLIVISTRSINDRLLQPARRADSGQLKAARSPNLIGVFCNLPLATRMKFYFAIITLTDITYISIVILSFLDILRFQDREFDLLISILGSWMTIRVLVIFLLLDSFLKSLKSEKKGKKPIKKNNGFIKMRMQLERVLIHSWNWSWRQAVDSSTTGVTLESQATPIEFDSIPSNSNTGKPCAVASRQIEDSAPY